MLQDDKSKSCYKDQELKLDTEPWSQELELNLDTKPDTWSFNWSLI